jgi:hypothetical protein
MTRGHRLTPAVWQCELARFDGRDHLVEHRHTGAPNERRAHDDGLAAVTVRLDLAAARGLRPTCRNRVRLDHRYSPRCFLAPDSLAWGRSTSRPRPRCGSRAITSSIIPAAPAAIFMAGVTWPAAVRVVRSSRQASENLHNCGRSAVVALSPRTQVSTPSITALGEDDVQNFAPVQQVAGLSFPAWFLEDHANGCCSRRVVLLRKAKAQKGHRIWPQPSRLPARRVACGGGKGASYRPRLQHYQ